MARPTKNDIDSGIQSWDGKIDDNDEALFNAPLPIHEHTGDESDLQATFPAASYDRCTVMVDHTTLGWSYYVSDGVAWNRMGAMEQTPTIVDLTDSTGGTGNDTVVAVPAINGSGATTAQEGAINDNFADLIDKVAEITSALRDHGFIV
jgi:hypothetical protein